MSNIQIFTAGTTADICNVVDILIVAHLQPSAPGSPVMYMDLEGTSLSRHGSISIVTILATSAILPTDYVFLIDVHTLGAQAFTTPGTHGQTLQSILQDATKTKVFFDVRNDSDALFAHYGIALAGIEDVQLMESATRPTTQSRRLVAGLTTCIEENLTTPSQTASLTRWKLVKRKGEKLFNPNRGGSYAVFNQRPIPADIIAYCAGDVALLPALRAKLFAQTARQRDMIVEQTAKRVLVSQSAGYQPQGPDKATAPWTRAQNQALDALSQGKPGRGYMRASESPDLDDYLADRDDFSADQEAEADFFDYDDDDDDDDWDDGPYSCRDVISDWDSPLYYSD
jgi:exonuclease 3'-5' domain-containing protein 1